MLKSALQGASQGDEAGDLRLDLMTQVLFRVVDSHKGPQVQIELWGGVMAGRERHRPEQSAGGVPKEDEKR